MLVAHPISLTDQKFPRPSGMFGVSLTALNMINDTNAIKVDDSGELKQTNFDPNLTRHGTADARFLKMPLVTRAIVKGLCDRESLQTPGDYGEFIHDAKINVEIAEPQPESTQEDAETVSISQIYDPNNKFRDGDYIVDDEILRIRVDYHTEVVGNQNIIAIDASGVLKTASAKSQRIYQSKVPQIVITASGKALRIGQPASPKPIPLINDQGSEGSTGSLLQLIPKTIQITNSGPFPFKMGNVAMYGVTWTYVLTKELDGDFFSIDPVTGLTKFKIPKRPTRANQIFTDEVMTAFNWDPDKIFA